jgi:hypothetical protein
MGCAGQLQCSAVQRRRGTALEGRQCPRVSLPCWSRCRGLGWTLHLFRQQSPFVNSFLRLFSAPISRALSCKVIPKWPRPTGAQAWASLRGYPLSRKCKYYNTFEMGEDVSQGTPRKSLPLRCQVGHCTFNNISHVPCLPSLLVCYHVSDCSLNYDSEPLYKHIPV